MAAGAIKTVQKYTQMTFGLNYRSTVVYLYPWQSNMQQHWQRVAGALTLATYSRYSHIGNI